MICPKCGEAIEDGAVYCEHCGEEIHIVPDFDIDIDFAAQVLAREMIESEQRIAQEQAERIAFRKRKIKFALFGAVALGILLLGSLLGYSIYTKSYSYQIKQANVAIQNEDYKEAAVYLEKAYAFDETDMDLLLDLAESYLRSEQIERFVASLEKVILESKATEAQQVKAYTKLISYYDSKKEYEAIVKLLDGCSISQISIEYQRYIALAPEFSYPEGEYESMVPLKLSSNTTGKIYYTVDGSIPKEQEDMLYTAPLFLEAGEHVVSAIFVNEYGIVSDVVSKEYIVELAVPGAPEVYVSSGTYNSPTMIEILEFDDITVYYTVDGTFPSNQSTLYKGPIPMPLGNSVFRFVGYNEDGVAGEVTEREYSLVLDTNLTVDSACYDVIKKMMDIGKISDTIGTAVGVDGWYKYQFQYPIRIEGQGDFYVIAEVLQDISGNREKTGTYYGVNIDDRNIYKLSKDESGNYLLEGF
ncbi:MAG: chitobiase/beta-hexosaminidase C-terminal domain-containing protein [Lachnospiraceae bacterium]|nr:chitobiase/beta-hexosaminidase C-terminal domain-containing protein [Lachnospiraceae bacterium]MBQ7360859.1 chitobiase/beta-hexosaminidase C-terminal domain-containing protein [Lachnospiraceae bacterium]